MASTHNEQMLGSSFLFIFLTFDYKKPELYFGETPIKELLYNGWTMSLLLRANK